MLSCRMLDFNVSADVWPALCAFMHGLGINALYLQPRGVFISSIESSSVLVPPGVWNEMPWGQVWYVDELVRAIAAEKLKTRLVLLDAVHGVDQVS